MCQFDVGGLLRAAAQTTTNPKDTMDPIQPTNVPLTVAEANALMELIDLAVKAGGLQVAATAVAVAQKIQAPFQPPAPETKE